MNSKCMRLLLLRLCKRLGCHAAEFLELVVCLFVLFTQRAVGFLRRAGLGFYLHLSVLPPNDSGEHIPFHSCDCSQSFLSLI